MKIYTIGNALNKVEYLNPSMMKEYRISISSFSLCLLINALFLLLNIFTTNNIKGFFLSGVWLAFLYLGITSIFIFFPKIQKLLFVVSWSFSSIVGFFRLKLGIVYSFDIAASTIQTMSEPHLAFELMEGSFYAWIILVIIIPIIVICFIIRVRKVKFKEIYIPFGVVFLSSALISAACIHYFEMKRKKGQMGIGSIEGSFQYYSPFDIAYFTNLAYKTLQKQNKIQGQSDFIRLSDSYEFGFNGIGDLKIIFILGETMRGDKFARKELTPNISLLESLYRFKDATSCHTNTLASTKCMFSRMKFENYSELIKESAFTDILKAVNFKTKIFSMQQMTSFYQYLGCDKMMTQYEIMKLSDNSIGNTPYDEALSGILQKEILEGKELFLLHTLGSHYDYSERYPKGFEVIKPSCDSDRRGKCSTSEIVNSYDNSVLYTDKIISDIIKIADKYKAIVFYVSDHGEQLGERGFFGHASPKGSVKEEHDIPFLIYLTPKLRETYYGKQIKKALDNNKNKKGVSHDNVFHTVLGCAGIYNKNKEKPLIDESLDLCYYPKRNNVNNYSSNL